VAQQLPHGHRLGRRGVGEVEVRQVGDDGLVDVEQPLVGQLHDQGGGPSLGDRADLEHRVGGRLDLGRMAEDAGREVEHFAVAVNADGCPGNLVLGDQRGQLRGDPTADLIQIWHGATIGPRAGCPVRPFRRTASRPFVGADERDA
jgi:hypothetical protein